MPATMQQPTINQVDASEPFAINATVTVTRGADPHTFQHDVTTLSAQGTTGSKWIVTWTLAPSSDPDLSIKFKNPGITILSTLPDGVTDLIITPPTPTQQPIKQQLMFTNNVTDVNVIRYDLNLDVEDKVSKLTHRVIFDPTIAVIKDPLDPPTT